MHAGGFPLEAMDGLQSYRWPGNVRELRNILEGCGPVQKEVLDWK